MLSTRSTASQCMRRGACFVLPDRLQSTMTSLVLLPFSTRLLSKHHCVSYRTLLHFGLIWAKGIVCTNQKSFGSFRFSFGKRSHVAMSFLKRKGFLLATQRNNTILFKTIFQLEKTLFYNSFCPNLGTGNLLPQILLNFWLLHWLTLMPAVLASGGFGLMFKQPEMTSTVSLSLISQGLACCMGCYTSGSQTSSGMLQKNINRKY